MKPKDQKPQTHELFSDSISEASISTTSLRRDSTRKDGAVCAKAYLDRRAVKFVNVPVGGRFLLNSFLWEKVDSGNAKCLGNSAKWEILPETYVFEVEDNEVWE